tara:strand:+ start:61 stop:471 length:411 start_codon:yes stop_codon:yes gene_type:complete
MDKTLVKDYDYANYEHKYYKYKLCIEQSAMTNITGFEIDHDYFNLDTNGVLVIRHGYCWNGSSGPTWDTASTMRASLFHDALYQMIRERDLSLDSRYLSDKVYYRLCLEDGMWRWRAWCHYRAVRAFGASSARPSS